VRPRLHTRPPRPQPRPQPRVRGTPCRHAACTLRCAARWATRSWARQLGSTATLLLLGRTLPLVPHNTARPWPRPCPCRHSHAEHSHSHAEHSHSHDHEHDHECGPDCTHESHQHEHSHQHGKAIVQKHDDKVRGMGAWRLRGTCWLGPWQL
jgi:hypothetical protein